MLTQPVVLESKGHAHGHDLIDHLYIHKHTAIHELPAHLKIFGAILLIFVFVGTPSRQPLAFAGYLLILLGIAAIARISLKTLARRMLIEVPFVFFAVLIPFTAGGRQILLAGIELSVEGLWVAFGILAKSSLGVLTSILLSATTKSREILSSLSNLKVPGTLIQITAFMLRYTAVVTDEAHRMKIARISRGFRGKSIKDWKVLGQSISALFIRSYERGERVHLAMLSRGFDGKNIYSQIEQSTTTQKILVLSPALIALMVHFLVRIY